MPSEGDPTPGGKVMLHDADTRIFLTMAQEARRRVREKAFATRSTVTAWDHLLRDDDGLG